LGTPIANVVVNFAITNGTASLSAGSATTNSSGFATITANLTNLSANVQVSACVAPNNLPCQTFTLFSTPTSLWTLETVSGSSQAVLTGQAFQRLVMRATDGSSAANPVMGVNVTFQTTLAQVNAGGDGMPVLLGSSQAQVATDQNGLASIVPSAGSVGPCDLFITVSAGQSTAQLQMESLAAIVTGRANSPATAPSAGADPNFAPNFAPNFGSNLGPQRFGPQSVPEMLFAVPQGIASNDAAVDSHGSDCAAPCAVDVSGDRGDTTTSNPAGSEKSASPPPATLPPADATAPKKPARPVGSDVAPRDAPGPMDAPGSMETQTDPPSSKWLPEDKRSCRVLAGDGPIF
jgi:hypothetical protein